MNEYKEYHGMHFDARTEQGVCSLLEMYNRRHTRIRIYWGDTETGLCWMDEWDNIGRVGKSCGQYHIPLMIKTARSTGGGAILDNCILKIVECDTKMVTYQHPLFHMPAITIDGSEVLFDGKLQARFDSPKKAEKYAAYMKGDRNSKS